MTATTTSTASTATPADGEASVLIRVDRGVGRITLNRPRQLNAIDHEMVHAMTAALQEWGADRDVTAVVIDGAGERGLCAGGDIKAIHADAVAGKGRSIDYWRDEYRLNVLISRFPRPVLALMDGIVMGGGVGISAHAGHRVVTERSRVGMPEVGIGVIPDVGGTWLLSRTPGQLGLHLGLTGQPMSGADAILTGFADHFVPAGELGALIDAVAEDGVEAALALFAEHPPASALAAEREWIDRCYVGRDVADILDLLEREQSPAAARDAAAIRAASPTSVTVALRAIREAGARTLDEAIEVELTLMGHALRQPDLIEGIRAQVVDKDRNPQWRPATLDAVGSVDHWFTAPATEPVFPWSGLPSVSRPTAK